MQLKDKYEIRQIFINITNTRGLLWTDIVEGILFNKSGFPRLNSNDVKIDDNSLVTKLQLNNTEEVINYILVLDYLIDYLKNEYNLRDIEITSLLEKYLNECNVVHFEKLNGQTGSWIIPSSLIIKENHNIFERCLTEIIILLINKHLKQWSNTSLLLKQELSRENINDIILIFMKKIGNNKIKQLLSLDNKDNDILWTEFIKQLKKFINEKKNSPTSS